MFDKLPPFVHLAARFLARARRVVGRELIVIQRDSRHQTIAIALLAGTCALAFGLALHGMQRAETRLGSRTVAYFALRDFAPGEVIDAASVITRRIPSIAIAPSTLTSTPVALVARQHVTKGDVFNTTNVHTDPRLHLPPGWRLVMVVPVIARPNLAPGSNVDIVVDADVVAARVFVADTIDEGRQVLVAVPAEHAALVATLAVTGEVSLISS
ncbi:MAG: hypothetical protein ACKOFZ_03005 [Ilumatobacteraceae bacterium]